MRERERKCVRDNEIEIEFSKRTKADVASFGGNKKTFSHLQVLVYIIDYRFAKCSSR